MIEVRNTTGASPSSVDVHGVQLEVARIGRGRPILFLHPVVGIEPDAAVLSMLAEGGEVLAPSHPGFGRSAKPKHITTVEDISYIYLDLLEQLDLREVMLVGVSLGAWIAASIAVKSSDRISRLVLADPFGIKLGSAEDNDIANMFMLPQAEFDALAFADIANAPGNWAEVDPEKVRIAARNREMTTQLGWLPYMYDPKLRSRLHRIKVPTLFLWGDQDRVITKSYVRSYSELLPDSSMKTIAGAGHYPHIEQPRRFANVVLDFLDSGEDASSSFQHLLP